MLAHSPRVSRALMVELFERSQARQWGLTVEAFQAVLEASAAHALGARSTGPDDVERYLASLHLADLALATACAAGQRSDLRSDPRDKLAALLTNCTYLKN